MTSPYPRYRDSGVDWLGDIPDHWVVRPIRHVCAFTYGDALRTEVRAMGEVPVLGSNGVVDHHDVANTSAPVVVVGRKGSFGAVTYCENAAFVIDTAYFIDERSSDSDLRWLYYTLTCADLADVSMDSAVPGLSREHAYKKPVGVPPLPEQRSIASFLDRRTADIDALIEKNRLLIERLAEYRTALVTHTVTRGLPPEEAEAAGLDPNPPMRDSGVEWLGEVPGHWGAHPLKALLTQNDGGVWGHEPEGAEETIVLRSTEQTVDGGWTIIDPAVRALTPRERKDARLLAGDLLVTKSSGSEAHIGKTSFVTEQEAALGPCFSNFMQRLRCHSRLEPRLVWYLLNARVGRQQLVFGSNTTTGLANLNSTILGNVMVPLPPLFEQRSVVSFLDRKVTDIDTLRAWVETAIERLQEYRSALVTAAVTGKIDVRDAAPAETEACRA